MNESVWKTDAMIKDWTAKADEREGKYAPRWQFMSLLLPFQKDQPFTFLDLGAGTGAASRTILAMYPKSQAILADFSTQMMQEGEAQLQQFEGRYRYVEFDMMQATWPEEIPTHVDTAVTSLCIHHIPDDRKLGMFKEIFEHLVPGGWYVNFDPVTSEDPIVAATWERTNDRIDPQLEHKRHHRSDHEQARFENHVRYMIPLDVQLGYLRDAGFEGIDVYMKDLENVIYGGRKPI